MPTSNAAADYYQILGLNRKARPAEIKKAYKRLARKCHPDLNPGNPSAAEQFKRITMAYEVLSNPSKKRQYDRMGPDARSVRSSSGFSPEGFGFDRGAGGFGRGFSEIFEELFRSEPSRPSREPRPGEDKIYPLTLSFHDAIRGLSVSLTLDGEASCPHCHGLGVSAAARTQKCGECGGAGNVQRLGGRIRYTSPCRRCRGTGVLTEEACGSCRGAGTTQNRERIRVKIPPGVDTGARVRVAGKGGPGILGGPPGDMHIQIQVEDHPIFSRVGPQILCTVPISFTEAALGAKIQVPTLEGPSTIRIPPGTQSGQKIRLAGKGAPSPRGAARGDQIVEISVITPEIRDEKARALLRELAEIDSADLRHHLVGKS